jgi:hypothetical protein
MEHERAMTKMRSHLACAGQELHSAQRFLVLRRGGRGQERPCSGKDHRQC